MSNPSSSDRQKVAAAWRVAIIAVETMAERGESEAAAPYADKAAALAETIGNPNQLRRTGRALQSLHRWAAGGRLIALAERIEQPDGPPEWDGTPLDGTLLIVERKEHVGPVLRWSRFIPMAAARAKRCVVLAEPRLAPLFARNFPGVEVVARDAADKAALPDADTIAGYRTLMNHFAPEGTALRDGFRPLQPDRRILRRIRRRYSGHPRPLIGIAWASTNTAKELPTLADWAAFLRAMEATCVSLQYGDVAKDVGVLAAASGREVIHDAKVDSLLDLESYAAQIAAMDAVVTISNTCAHVAGALGVRTFLVVDDQLRFEWLNRGGPAEWYPTMTIVRKQCRNWDEVFADVSRRLSDYCRSRT